MQIERIKLLKMKFIRRYIWEKVIKKITPRRKWRKIEIKEDNFRKKEIRKEIFSASIVIIIDTYTNFQEPQNVSLLILP